MPNNDNKPVTKKELHLTEARLNQKIDSVETKLNQKIDSVETKLEQKIDKVGMEVVKTNIRLGTVEHNIISGMREFRSELLKAFEDSVVKGAMYEQKALTHKDILMAHEDKLFKHEKRIEALENKSD